MTNQKTEKNRIPGWFINNIAALVLAVLFAVVFIWTQNNENAVRIIGTTSIQYLNNQFYRWFTCIFYHYSFLHLFFNSVALIAIGSLINGFTGKIRTAFVFILGGALAEIPFSIIVNYGEPGYGGGSSGGIFALIAVFLVCRLRFGERRKLKWYRPDLLVTLLFFVFANDNVSSFLTHAFGFIAGILIGTFMIVTGIIKLKAENPQDTPCNNLGSPNHAKTD